MVYMSLSSPSAVDIGHDFVELVSSYGKSGERHGEVDIRCLFQDFAPAESGPEPSFGSVLFLGRQRSILPSYEPPASSPGSQELQCHNRTNKNANVLLLIRIECKNFSPNFEGIIELLQICN